MPSRYPYTLQESPIFSFGRRGGGYFTKCAAATLSRRSLNRRGLPGLQECPLPVSRLRAWLPQELRASEGQDGAAAATFDLVAAPDLLLSGELGADAGCGLGVPLVGTVMSPVCSSTLSPWSSAPPGEAGSRMDGRHAGGFGPLVAGGEPGKGDVGHCGVGAVAVPGRLLDATPVNGEELTVLALGRLGLLSIRVV
jgi:hypothetical protein